MLELPTKPLSHHFRWTSAYSEPQGSNSRVSRPHFLRGIYFFSLSVPTSAVPPQEALSHTDGLSLPHSPETFSAHSFPLWQNLPRWHLHRTGDLLVSLPFSPTQHVTWNHSGSFSYISAMRSASRTLSACFTDVHPRDREPIFHEVIWREQCMTNWGAYFLHRQTGREFLQRQTKGVSYAGVLCLLCAARWDARVWNWTPEQERCQFPR